MILKRYGYVIYCIILLLAFVFKVNYNLIFNKAFYEIISYIALFTISAIGLYSFARTDRKSGFLLILSLITSILISQKWFLLIPSLLFLPIVLLNDYKSTYKILVTFFTIPILLVIFISFSFNNFAKVQELERVANIDNSLDYIVIEIDQGGLGVDYIVFIEKEFFNICKVQKKIKILQSLNTQMEWFDEKSLKIGNEIYDYFI